MNAITRLLTGIGRATAWLIPLLVLVVVLVVVLRYAFASSPVALQELAMYLHGIILLLGIPYALTRDAHVRVDIVHSRLDDRRKAIVELAGHTLFLIPVCICILWASAPYVQRSWRVLEGSSEVGGIPAVYLLKSLIPVMALLLLVAALAHMPRLWRQARNRGSAVPTIND